MPDYYGPGTEDLRITLLSHAEEKRLFCRFYKGLTRGPHHKNISEDRMTEDSRKARDEIIRQFLLFTAKHAIMFAKGALPDDQAISVGNYGLIRVLHQKKFRPGKNFRFATFLRFEILGAITFEIDKDRLREKRLNRLASELLTNGSAYDPDNALDANRLMHPGHRVGWNKVLKPDWIDESHDNNPFYENELNSDRRFYLHTALKGLNRTERYVFLRSILWKATGPEIAKKLGISRERVRQILAAATRKMKRYLEPLKAQMEI